MQREVHEMSNPGSESQEGLLEELPLEMSLQQQLIQGTASAVGTVHEKCAEQRTQRAVGPEPFLHSVYLRP